MREESVKKRKRKIKILTLEDLQSIDRFFMMRFARNLDPFTLL